MSFRAWRHWFVGLPWSLKWFVILVLLRPLVDALYFLKDISPFLSPLYIVGGLTPVLIAASYLSDSFPEKRFSGVDLFFVLWAWLSLFNAMVLVGKDGLSVDSLGHLLYFVTPAFIYLYVRHFIQSKQDLQGLITTVLYSIIVPSILIVYENLFMPLSTQLSRDMTRFQGIWADVVSYGMFFTTGLLAACYFFLERDTGVPDGKRVRVLVAVTITGLIGLLSIHHSASWIIFIVVFALFVWHSTGGRTSLSMLVVVVLVAGSYLIFGDAISASFGNTIQRELNVIEREDKGIEDLFHGRGHRWAAFLALWEPMPSLSKLFGVTFGTLDMRWQSVPVRYMTLRGVHSDYFRLLFATGLVGLIAYLFFLGGTFVRSLRLPKAERFLVWGGLAILVLYSVSTTPTLYATIQYICFSIIAYAASPGTATLASPTAPRFRPVAQIA